MLALEKLEKEREILYFIFILKSIFHKLKINDFALLSCRQENDFYFTNFPDIILMIFCHFDDFNDSTP